VAAEHGSVDPSRSTRRPAIASLAPNWEVVGQHPLYHPGGTACVLALAVEKRRCLRHCPEASPGASPSELFVHLNSF
jgi:hypothetical protein